MSPAALLRSDTQTMLPSAKHAASAIPIFSISRLNHFNLAIYGLSSRCLRLTHVVTSMRSRLALECGERRFSKEDFHPDYLTPRGALVWTIPDKKCAGKGRAESPRIIRVKSKNLGDLSSITL